MSISIRIEDAMYHAAKKTAAAEHRSIPKQIQFWAELGKCALENPDLPIDFIKDILVAKRLGADGSEVFEFED